MQKTLDDLHKMMLICITNGFKFSVDKNVVWVVYRIPRGICESVSLHQKFTMPFNFGRELECIQTVVTMINANDPIEYIESHINSFVPF